MLYACMYVFTDETLFLCENTPLKLFLHENTPLSSNILNFMNPQKHRKWKTKHHFTSRHEHTPHTPTTLFYFKLLIARKIIHEKWALKSKHKRDRRTYHCPAPRLRCTCCANQTHSGNTMMQNSPYNSRNLH